MTAPTETWIGFGKRLRELLPPGRTQVEWAAMCKIGADVMGKILTDPSKKPRIDTITKIIENLELSDEDIIFLMKGKRPPTTKNLPGGGGRRSTRVEADKALADYNIKRKPQKAMLPVALGAFVLPDNLHLTAA